MSLKDAPIRRKLIVIILLTTVTALLLMRGIFMTYEFLDFERSTTRQLDTVGKIIAANSTAALAFANPDDAAETLSALKAERYITAAALYDQNGKLFSKYPAKLADAALPAAPRADGIRRNNLPWPDSCPSCKATNGSARFTSGSTWARSSMNGCSPPSASRRP